MKKIVIRNTSDIPHGVHLTSSQIKPNTEVDNEDKVYFCSTGLKKVINNHNPQKIEASMSSFKDSFEVKVDENARFTSKYGTSEGCWDHPDLVLGLMRVKKLDRNPIETPATGYKNKPFRFYVKVVS